MSECPKRWTPAVKCGNDPRAIVEEKLKHGMFDAGWGAWKKDYSQVSMRYRVHAPVSCIESYSNAELKRMVLSILGDSAGIENADVYKDLATETLSIGILPAEMDKLQDAIDEDGPGSQKRNIVTLPLGRHA